MKLFEKDTGNQIIEKAKELGASLVGIASVDTLKTSPSHSFYRRFEPFNSVGNREGHLQPGQVDWPEKSGSVIVLALSHPRDEPAMDWWQTGIRGGTAGNQRLISINKELSRWLERKFETKTYPLSYHIERGGIFLKDAAVMAGLGCIGKNNMLVTPEYGPRVRLRAMLTEEVFPAGDSVAFDPCSDCFMPCLDVCPQLAFQKKIYIENDVALDKLPARNGIYNRQQCNKQMLLDEESYEETEPEGWHGAVKLVKYCRRCEWACPIGN